MQLVEIKQLSIFCFLNVLIGKKLRFIKILFLFKQMIKFQIYKVKY